MKAYYYKQFQAPVILVIFPPWPETTSYMQLEGDVQGLISILHSNKYLP